MHKFKSKCYQSSLNCLVVILTLASCQSIDNTDSSVQMIRDLKNLPKEKLTELSFGQDTIYLPFPKSKGKFRQKIYAKNTGIISLNVSTVVASCNCTKVSFDKKFVRPSDSLGIDMTIDNDGKFIRAALTVVGNLPNGQKTIYLMSE